MKLKNLQLVTTLKNSIEHWKKALIVLEEEDASSMHYQLECYITNRSRSFTLGDLSTWDQGKDSPLAALVKQALLKKIAELEKELQLLGVDLEDE